MDDGLTLEKLKIDERLREVEKHMQEAKPVRETIINSITVLTNSITKLEHVVYGNGKNGVVQELELIKNTVNLATNVLNKILWVVITAIVLSSVPHLAEFIFKITH